MKNVGLCTNCGRNIYTNEINLCKRCYQDVGLEFLKQQEPEEEVEEETKSLEELGIEETDEEIEEPTEDVVEEEKKE